MRSAGLFTMAAKEENWVCSADWAGTPICTKVGDKIPPVILDFEFGDDQQKVRHRACVALHIEARVSGCNDPGRGGAALQINIAERCAGKKVLLLGLPGAFTPC